MLLVFWRGKFILVIYIFFRSIMYYELVLLWFHVIWSMSGTVAGKFRNDENSLRENVDFGQIFIIQESVMVPGTSQGLPATSQTGL